MLYVGKKAADCEIGSPFFTLKSITIFKIQPIRIFYTFAASLAYKGKQRLITIFIKNTEKHLNQNDIEYFATRD